MGASSKPSLPLWATLLLVLLGVPSGWMLLHIVRGGLELPPPMWTAADLVPLPPPERNAWHAIGASQDIPEPHLRPDLLDDRKPIASDDQKEVDAELARPEVRALLDSSVGVSQLPRLAEPNDLKWDSPTDSLRLLYWRRWVALSINRKLEGNPAAALGLLRRLYALWIDCAVSSRSRLTFLICADSAERELELLARAVAILGDSANADSRRATAVAIGAAPPLTEDNMTMGEYVTQYSFLESLVPESRWDYLVLTDLEQTADLINRTFHPDSSDNECATRSGERRPPLYSYNALGKLLVRTAGLGFCSSLPAIRRAVKTDAAKRIEVVRLLEGQ